MLRFVNQSWHRRGWLQVPDVSAAPLKVPRILVKPGIVRIRPHCLRGRSSAIVLLISGPAKTNYRFDQFG